MDARIVKGSPQDVVRHAQGITKYLLDQQDTMSAEDLCKNIALLWRDARREIRDGKLEG